ncbi:phage head closure protein [uncultured Devosia sp.]|uniref:phage head closure protein n=1 Tax=uncultured Devosia sp. TaxID=211434 RepID=UPI0035C97672
MSERIPLIGTLTDRVQIRRKEMTAQAEGGFTTLYVPMQTVWARVRSLSGRQLERGDGRAVAISHSVVFRFRADVGPGDQIVYRGRNLDVVSASDLNGRRAYLSCACSETSFMG